MSDAQKSNSLEEAKSGGDAGSGSLREVVAMDVLRQKIDTLLESGEHARAIDALEKACDRPDSTRFLDENLWLYGELGRICHAFDENEKALEAYERAHELDPREVDYARPYAELLIDAQRGVEATEVMRRMLVHRRDELDAPVLGWIYRHLGAMAEAEEDWAGARRAYERAHQQSHEDQEAIAGLLRAVNEVGRPDDVIEARRRLIRTLDDPESRAQALMAMGDDWRDGFNDPWRALDTYEEALAEDPQSDAVLKRIAQAAERLEDWRRLSRAYFTLSRLADGEAAAADWLIKSSDVAKEELWEPEKALAGYRAALAKDPTRLDAFKQVTSLLVDARDWRALEEAYLQLISANLELDAPDQRLLAVLWQKLGELYHTHLEQPSDAVTAFDRASDLAPQDVDLHEQVAKLAEANPDLAEVALGHLASIRALDPTRLDTYERSGRVLLRQKKVDAAFCYLRAYEAMGGQLEGKARSFVERLSSSIIKIPTRSLDANLLKRFVVSEEIDANLSTVFRILKPALEDWVGEKRGHYGLGWRDTVKLKEPLAFNNLYQKIGNSLGFEELPKLWRKPEQQGLINGALKPPGMIVGDELLGSGRERHIAFVLGKQLVLFQEAFYLAAIRRKTDLQAFYLLAAQLVNPDYQFERDDRSSAVLREIKRGVKGAELSRLEEAVAGSMTDGIKAKISRWVEALEDTANRVGFVFCDDLGVVRDYLEHDPQSISDRSVDERMRDLVEYSVSDRYLTLREELGQSVG